MKRHFLIIASVLTIAAPAIGLGSVAIAHAETSTSVGTSHKHPHHRARIAGRLDQAMRDGVISSSQKTALKAELQKLRTERKNSLNKSSTPQQRQAERTMQKSELETWAKSTSFPLAKIFPKLGS